MVICEIAVLLGWADFFGAWSERREDLQSICSYVVRCHANIYVRVVDRQQVKSAWYSTSSSHAFTQRGCMNVLAPDHTQQTDPEITPAKRNTKR